MFSYFIYNFLNLYQILAWADISDILDIFFLSFKYVILFKSVTDAKFEPSKV